MVSADFLLIFIDESQEHIQSLNEGLLALENSPDDQECLQEIARNAHTLKGGSKMMGFDDINQIAHKMEDLLIGAREGELRLNPHAMDLLFEGLDVIGTLINAAANNQNVEVNFEGLCQNLENLTLTLKSAESSSIGSDLEVEIRDSADEQADTPETEPVSLEVGRPPDHSSKILEMIDRLSGEFYELEIEAVEPGHIAPLLPELDSLNTLLDGSENPAILQRLGAILRMVISEELVLTDGILSLMLQGLAGGALDVEAAALGEQSEWDSQEFCSLLEENIPELNRHLTEREQPTTTEVRMEEAGRQATEVTAQEAPSTDLVTAAAKGTALKKSGQQGIAQRRTSSISSTRQKNTDERIRVQVSQLESLDSVVGEMLVDRISSEAYKHSIDGLAAETRTGHNALNGLLSELNHAIAKLEVAFAQYENSPLAEKNGYNRLANIQRELTNQYKLMNAVGQQYTRLHEDITDLSISYSESHNNNGLIVDQLQNTVKDMRLVPVSMVFDFFPRAVRDLEKELGKEIELILKGKESRLDKTLVDRLRSPLLHLIRNSADHGIETPDIREASGKPRTGKLILSAEETADRIAITMEDDGAGINADKIKKSAIEKGIIDQSEADAMNSEEAIYLICAPGFSTAVAVTDTSGRGVGMDVVKKEIESEMKGELQINSELGKGTTVTLFLPLTLSDSKMCIVESRETFFAIPTVNVEKTEFISPDQVMSIANKLAIAIQGNLIPMVYLSDVLGMQEITEVKKGDEIRVIIVKHGHQLIAFVVDDFHGVKLMVIKSLGDYLRRVRNIAGTSIMGNGEIAFILHVPDLMASASSGTKGTFKTVQALTPATKVEILVVEDSMMTREFERNILESVGYNVDVAVDGLDGLEKMGEKDYNLVVSDIEMPRMNGFEFISSFRKDKRFQHIPTIIVTSLDSEEEKQKGLAAGADKYIVKSAFDKDTLLQAVEGLVGQ